SQMRPPRLHSARNTFIRRYYDCNRVLPTIPIYVQLRTYISYIFKKSHVSITPLSVKRLKFIQDHVTDFDMQ
ncbi:hypothetical protein COCCADRAFT_113073, partial [Bipolaris zeicola 26-R-13]